jgi:alpha-beta hydrolase superfamily lysophospholipase
VRSRKPNWNLTFEIPASQPKGAVLLLHGLTDSPYSMRALAAVFAARGWYVVGSPGGASSRSGKCDGGHTADRNDLAARYLARF